MHLLTQPAAPAHYQSLEFERVTQVVGQLFATRAKLRILDYGCGRGRYLDAFRDLGCDTTAVDANSAYVDEARARGFVAYSPEALLAGSVEPFDVILLSHVIEHLPPNDLVDLMPRLCGQLRPEGLLLIVTPVPGDRFYHDLSHVRPYLPQSIRHAFGQTGGSFVYEQRALIELTDIYFFRDPFRTRMLRHFYVKKGWRASIVRVINAAFDALWRASSGGLGRTSSWLGVYRLVGESAQRSS